MKAYSTSCIRCDWFDQLAPNNPSKMGFCALHEEVKRVWNTCDQFRAKT